MNIKEKTANLFEVSQGYYLVHCISADFALGAGIAKQFDEIFDMRKKLGKQFQYKIDRIGKAYCVDNVFNLVIKDGCYDKAGYVALTDAIKDMKVQMLERDITKLAIPQLGSYREKLEWDVIRSIFEEIFEDTDVEILICSL